MKKLIMLSDKELVDSFCEGNSKAFDELLRRHQEQVFTYIERLVGDYDTANDIFQDTFIKVITTIRNGNYTDKGKFSAWLMRIAHNMVMDYYRRDNSATHLSTDTEQGATLNDASLAQLSRETEMVNMQQIADLHHIIDKLPPSQQEVVRMRFFQDMSFKEIAEATGVSINTALGRMRYSMTNLRNLAKVHDLAAVE